MATGDQNQIEVLENLRKQLAVAVRSIQWSYAIFWSSSSRQPGMLEWGGGYYNGDIKTRKTVQSAELNTDQLGLQRSDQLRELYESLSLVGTSPQAKRPTAALSPEDLTDAEWYFLVCMSFIFNIDQGLPGRTLAKNKTIWLCNAHLTDTKIFSRSLLAKSASIQTIVCFPHLGGVIELGSTELVQEDLNLIQHIKTSFLEIPSVTGSHDNNIPDDSLNCLLDCPDMDFNSPNDSSNEFANNLFRDELNLVEGIDTKASQIQSQSRPFMDDVISNCLSNSANSSNSVSHTYEDCETIVPIVDGNKLELLNNNNNNNNSNNNNHQRQNNDDAHYQSVLSNLLKSSHQLMLGPYFSNGGRKSSFVRWRKDWLLRRAECEDKQKMLKKVLFEVAKMHENSRVNAGMNDNAEPRREVEEMDRNHVLSERKRREKINERFMILGSIIPSGGKVDKVSVLDHTIQYLRDLERKVEELESFKESIAMDSTTQTKYQDAIERTSDNYGPNKIGHSKKPSTNKRKACEIDRTGAENDITVSVIDRDVLIEMKCLSKDCVLVEIMEVVSKLRMDMQTVQSSTNDGILSITLKAKCKGLRAPSVGVIRQALQKVIKKC